MEDQTGRGPAAWLHNTNHNPGIVALIRRARKALPGDPDFGDPLSAAGRGRTASGCPRHRPAAARARCRHPGSEFGHTSGLAGAHRTGVRAPGQPGGDAGLHRPRRLLQLGAAGRRRRHAAAAAPRRAGGRAAAAGRRRSDRQAHGRRDDGGLPGSGHRRPRHHGGPRGGPKRRGGRVYPADAGGDSHRQAPAHRVGLARGRRQHRRPGDGTRHPWRADRLGEDARGDSRGGTGGAGRDGQARHGARFSVTGPTGCRPIWRCTGSGPAGTSQPRTNRTTSTCRHSRGRCFSRR